MAAGRLIKNERHLRSVESTLSPLAMVSMYAHGMGYTVEAIREEELCPVSQKRQRKLLKINGRLCLVLYARKAHQDREVQRQPYVHIRFVREVLKVVDFVIVVACPVGYPFGIFIYPASTVLKAHFRERRARARYVMIPLTHQPIYRNHRKRIPHWEHRFAWAHFD